MKWISVKDKLPDDDFLCEVKCENGKTFGYYLGGKKISKDLRLNGWILNVNFFLKTPNDVLFWKKTAKKKTKKLLKK